MTDAKIDRIELEIARAHGRIDDVRALAVRNREQLIEVSGRDGTNGKVGEMRRDIGKIREKTAQVCTDVDALIGAVEARVTALEHMNARVFASAAGGGGVVYGLIEIVHLIM